MHKVLLWSGFGIAVRLWQLGIEMRPLFTPSSLWVYGAYGGIGGSFGYWLMGVEQRQVAWLQERKAALVEKRKRRAALEGIELDEDGLVIQKKGVIESIKETLVGASDEGLTIPKSGSELK